MQIKFWTITDTINPRTQRFLTKASAITAAKKRIADDEVESICVMECIKLVKTEAAPIVVEDVTETPSVEPMPEG